MVDFTQNELDIIQIKNPYSMPIVVIYNKAQKSFKFLISATAKIVDVYALMRKKFELSTVESLMLFIGGRIIGLSTLQMSVIYQLYKHKNGVLYIHGLVENSFG